MFWPFSQRSSTKTKSKTLPTRRLPRPLPLSFDTLEDRRLLATLSGFTWIDLNNDGFRQSSEPGLSGVTITLTGTETIGGGSVNRTVVTGSDGSYSFDNVNPGTYSLTQTQPTGFRTGIDSIGSLGGSTATNVFSNIVVVNPSDAGVNYNFGERGILFSGRVFNDTNGNGVLDGGETGRSGVIVTLTNTGTGFSLPILSNGSGDYSFDNLAPGNYTITATNPDGNTLGFSTASTIPLNISNSGIPGGVLTNQNFGLTQVSSLAGLVFNDANNNGVQDAGENGLANVTLTLSGVQANAANFTRTLTTNADGTFNFTGLLPGTYSLTQVQPSGFTDGIITPGTAGGTVGPNLIANIVLGSGVTATGYLFAEISTATSSLSGSVFVDLNNDGIRQPNEPGLSGIVISLSGVDANGPVNRSTTTGGDGNWSFTGLLAGTYTVSQSQPAGWGQGQTRAGTAGGTVSGDLISGIVLGGGVDATGYTFGEQGITVRGRVFNDLNANGVLDAGETFRAGVTVTLLNQSTSTTFTAITNALGEYSFNNLGPASYTIQVVNPDTNNLALTTDASIQVTISNAGVVGGFINDRDFGLAQVSSLAGLVFDDRNNNGIQDAGEPGIANVTMTLTGVQNNGRSVTRTLQTSANGTFRFSGLLAGNFTLTQTQPANFTTGIITAGTAGGTVGDNVIVGIGLGVGVEATDYLFGEISQGSSSLSGSVYVDLNRDGIRQTNEPGLSGIVITLTGTDANGAVNRSTTTDSSGNWSFSGLLAGTYTVTQTQPSGWAQGTNRVGTAGGTISGDVISGIVIGQDVTETGYTFGELGVAIRGRVFNDANANGVLDAGELGRAGVVVTLRNQSTNQVFSAISDASGNYQFADLGPATYLVQITNPDTTNLAISSESPLSVVITNAGLTTGFVGDKDFGLARVSSLAGLVWDDRNGNHIRDAGEPGIANVTITLTGVQNNGQNITRTVQTGANGTYQFQGLLAGTYTITQTQPTGFDDGRAFVGTAGGTANTNVITNIILGVNVNGTGYNFSDIRIPSGSISGFVYVDVNNNGTRQPGEPGIAGVAMTLNGTDAQGNPVNLTTATLADGSFTFTGLRNGTYTLTQTQPLGFAQGTTRAGTAGGTVVGDVISNINLGANVNATNYLFGEKGVSFTGQVFNDLNANGVLDAGEPGRAAITVSLRNQATGVTATVRSNAAGNFTFENLGPGTYVLSAAIPSGFALTTPPGELTFQIPNEGTANGPIEPRNLGLAQVSSLAGVVYFDLDNDGIRQLTEGGLSNVQVQLTGTQNNGQAVNRSSVTSANGAFTFSGLLAGNYSITVTPPSGFVSGTHIVGTAGGELGQDSINNINLGSGVTGTNYTFAMVGDPETGLITGKVYFDANQNARLDATERGFAGVLVVLAGTDSQGNQVSRSTVTDASGNYFFAGLRPGTYQVQRVPQFGLVNSRGQVGNLGGTPRAYAQITDIVLAEGQTAFGYNFGEYGAGISRRFFLSSVR